MERIRLHNTAFEGLNNVYLLVGDETVLIDAGVSHPEVRTELTEGLAEHGLELADIDRLFLTHWHSDHAGLAGEIQDASGASVHVHKADAPLVSNVRDSFLADSRQQRATFDEWGIPDDSQEELVGVLRRNIELAGSPADVTPFVDGDTFEVNGRTLEAVHLPGHAAGLTAFADADADEAFVGDAILPKYTPNVGGADVRVEAPLAKYVASLVEIVDRDWDRAWPGHRDRIDDPAGRAATILRHHRERTENVVDALDRNGPSTPWEVSANLFGDLESIHILHGPGEAFAHLDHLAADGVAERDGREYVLVESDPDVDALFPDVGIDRVVEFEE
ncbi:MBL fold metallo-hydrolase [Halorarum halophilum]|uniref:MBL fold metallo-hydrolase n=1 Tax=Halorarum halophilum TaxID=2743090 RepID=A0A7D5KE19_9EURY|nr:MBL fold metallo-hydrolase [Halobaculum halophilum]QLG26476.1 MBL fold metallo-hydrolase [Halobaculum halophilum]